MLQLERVLLFHCLLGSRIGRREASARPARRTTRVHTWGNCPELNASRQAHGQTTARSFVPFARSICAPRARLLSRQGKSDLASEKIEEMVTMQVGSHP